MQARGCSTKPMLTPRPALVVHARVATAQVILIQIIPIPPPPPPLSNDDWENWALQIRGRRRIGCESFVVRLYPRCLQTSLWRAGLRRSGDSGDCTRLIDIIIITRYHLVTTYWWTNLEAHLEIGPWACILWTFGEKDAHHQWSGVRAIRTEDGSH